MAKENKNSLETELKFLLERRAHLEFRFSQYVANYHHSMAWIAAIFFGISTILVSFRLYSYLWVIGTIFLLITFYRLIMLKKVLSLSQEHLDKINSSLDKRYGTLNLDIVKLKEEVGLK